MVVKTPTCGCCTAWVAHLRRAGFQVRVSRRRRRHADGAAARRAGRSALLPHRLGRRLCDRGPCPRRRHHAPAPRAPGRGRPRRPRHADGLAGHGAWRPMRAALSDTILFTRAGRRTVFAVGTEPRAPAVAAAASRVSPSRLGSRTMPATRHDQRQHGGDDQQQVLKSSWPRQSMMCRPQRKS